MDIPYIKNLNFPVISGLSDSEALTIKRGIKELEIFKGNKFFQKDPKYKIFINQTWSLLNYSGSVNLAHYYIEVIKEWNKNGARYIPEALMVRYEEAKREITTPTNLGSDDIDVTFEESENHSVPLTQRSVAKALHFANIFCKLARG